MTRPVIFLGVASLFLILWSLLVMCFDFAVAQVSYDYIPAAKVGSRQAMNQGLFLSCLLAASCTVSKRRRALTARNILAGFAVLPLIFVLVVAAAGVSRLLLHSLGLLDDSGWHLAFPRRHALFVGMESGFTMGAWVAYLAGSVWAWGARATIAQQHT